MTMKHSLAGMTLILCLSVTQVSHATDPIVYYSFDELGATVVDESGNGHDGTPNGGIVLEDAGRYGKCFSFNGTDAYVELNRPVQDDFSLLAWIKTSDVAPGTAQAYQGNGLFWSDVGGTANDLVVGVINTKLSFFAGNPDTSVNSNADVVTDEWVHIAAVRHAESGSMSIYLNGQLDNSIVHANTGPLDAQPVMAIGANTLDGRYYNGLMDEVLIYDVPLTEEEIQVAMAGLGPEVAADPVPADELADVVRDGSLSWTPGAFAQTHDVYFGDTWEDVNSTTTPVSQDQDASTFDPGLLAFGQTYFWRVDEVNGAPDFTRFKGPVWSFTTADYQVVDDFESYDDDCHRIFFAWQDGLGHNGGENIDDCDVPSYGGNGTGSLVGNALSPFAEQAIVHSGGQSMPLGYEGADSEARLTFDAPRDWSKGGVTTLVLYTYGQPDNTSAQLYVKVNNAKVVYEGDANNILRARWTQWNIDLASLGINLSNVTSLSVGVEGAGSNGTVFVDDIRLYPVAPPIPEPKDPGSTGLVAYYALDNNADDGSGNGHHGTLQGGGQWVEGVIDQALQFNGSTSYIEVPDAPDLDMTNAITIAAWVNAYSFGDWRGFVTKGVNNSPYAMQMWGDGSLRFGWNWGTAGTGAVGSGNMNSNGKMASDEWTHLAVTYDGATLSFYLNGGLDT